MPVESISCIGVSSVAAGSSIAARGAIRGWANESLILRSTLVIPALLLNSAADKVVGTAVMRIRSESSGVRRGAPRFDASVASVSTSRIPRHSASRMQWHYFKEDEIGKG